jgi:hypothetical protein
MTQAPTYAVLGSLLRTEMPGKVLAPLPRKNMSSTLSTIGLGGSGGQDDASSVSSLSTMDTGKDTEHTEDSPMRNSLMPAPYYRLKSSASLSASPSPSGRASALPSLNGTRSTSPQLIHLHREDQRVSLRAFIRTMLQNHQIAESKAMEEFLTEQRINLNQEEMKDIGQRKEMDARRVEEQKQFYEIARKRAAALDMYMERFRRDIVEKNGLTKLFAEIRSKKTIQELSPEYRKFAEWLRIEVAATLYLYHLFLAEDNSPELFVQFRRIHSLVPYGMLKNVVRIANPAVVMVGVLDLDKT